MPNGWTAEGRTGSLAGTEGREDGGFSCRRRKQKSIPEKVKGRPGERIRRQDNACDARGSAIGKTATCPCEAGKGMRFLKETHTWP